jgi:hypothetical protein
MSWSVAKITNTVKISEAVARDLIQQFPNIPVLDYIESPEPSALLEGDKLFFDTDHSEHIDWLDDRILAVMASHKVEGDITFGSLEGDNRNTYWGYRFDGKGSYKHLTGKVVWE